MAAGQLGGLLYPTEDVLPNSPVSARQDDFLTSANQSFGQAIEAWNRHQYKTAYRLFGEHVQAFPNSPWAAEALLHQGCEARYEGRMSEAEQTYQDIITAQQDKTGSGSKRLLNKARLRMANLKVLQNDIGSAKAYYQQLKAEGSDWRDRTYASHWLLQLSKLDNDQLNLSSCGTQVLSDVLAQSGKAQAAQVVLTAKPSQKSGFSLKELQQLAKQHDYDLVGLRLKPEDLKKITLPAIAQIEWQNGKGHYWEIEDRDGDLLKLYDPQNHDHYEQTIQEFSRQWHGAALVFVETNKAKNTLPGQPLALNEMEAITGGCCGLPAPPDHLGDPDASSDQCTTCPCPNGQGQPVWKVNPITMNFYMKDIPLWYAPAKGPAIEFKLSYNSQSTTNYYEPFGNKWQFSYGTFLVEAPGGNVTVFLSDGKQLIFVKTAKGYRLAAEYGETSKLAKLAANTFTLTETNGLVYSYGIPGGTNSQQVFLTAMTDAYGNKLTFNYNSSAQLVGVTDADDKTSTLEYNAEGLVTRITDPFGRVAQFGYNTDRDLVELVDMGGIKTQLGYDADKYISTIDYGQGVWNIYTEPSDGIANGSNPYPAPGKKMWENYRITVTGPLGNKQEFHYDGYHKDSWHVSAKDYLNYKSSDINNYVKAPKTWHDIADSSSTGGYGVVTAIERPEGDRRTYGYNAARLITSLNYENSPTGSYAFKYNGLNHITRLTEPNGLVTQLGYAANYEDLISITDNRGIQAFEYNPYHDITAVTDRYNNKTAIEYSDSGQITQITDPLGVVTNFLYNADNRLNQINRDGKTVLNQTYDAQGRIASRTRADGITIGYVYDNLNRLTQISYPDGKNTVLAWSSVRPGLIDHVTLRDGRTAHFNYDTEQRLTIDINAENGQSRYEYDKNGNLVSFIDPNGTITRWQYDANDRVSNKIYVDNKQEIYAWNSRDSLASKRNARGATTTYSYNGNGKLTNVDSPGEEKDISYRYDIYSRVIQRTDALGIFKYEYDANDNLTKVDGPWLNDTITYQYDALNRRTSMTVEGGQTIEYRYDSLGRQSLVVVNGETFSLEYNGVNPLPNILTRPSGVTTDYQRDSLQRTTQVSNETSAGVVINRHAYTYNNQDLKDGETITSGNPYALNAPGVKTYQHNNLNQVLQSNPPERHYLYDADGNLTQGYTPQGYVFTASYDAANRLSTLQYTDAGAILHKIVYSYGGNNLVGQIDKYTGKTLTERTRFVRDGFLVVQELDGLNNNAVKRQYIWQDGAQGGIGRLLALLQNGQRYDYLYDDNGNVMALVDGAQQVVAQYSYSPFGQLQTASGALADQPMRFSTKYYDPETGLSDFGYRFYRADVGKWLTRDPIGEDGGLNIYTFTENNPINLTDPKGLEVECKVKWNVPPKVEITDPDNPFFGKINITPKINWNMPKVKDIVNDPGSAIQNSIRNPVKGGSITVRWTLTW